MQARDREKMGKTRIPHGRENILGNGRLASGDGGDGNAGDIAIRHRG